MHMQMILNTSNTKKSMKKMRKEPSRNQNKLGLAFGANNFVCNLLSLL